MTERLRRLSDSAAQTTIIARVELTILMREGLFFAFLFIIPTVLILVVGSAYSESSSVSLSQTVPGFSILFLFALTNYAGQSFFRDMWWQSWPRTLTLPVTRRVLVAGRLLPLFALGCLQMLTLTAGVGVVLGLPVRGSIPALAVVVAITVTVALELGIILACIARTGNEMSQIAYLFLVVGGAIGGGFAPLESLPSWAKTVSVVFPQRWAIDAVRTLLNSSSGFSDVWIDIIVLAGFALLSAMLVAVVFDFDRISTR